MTEKVTGDFPSPYITWEDIIDLPRDKRTLTIAKCDYVTLVSDDEKTPQKRRIIYFSEVKKGLVLCKTNAYSIAYLLGEMVYAKWVGGKVTLQAKRVRSFGATVNAVRLEMSDEVYQMVAAKVKGRGKHKPWIGEPMAGGAQIEARP